MTRGDYSGRLRYLSARGRAPGMVIRGSALALGIAGSQLQRRPRRGHRRQRRLRALRRAAPGNPLAAAVDQLGQGRRR
eukprot:1454392-Pyramimonas_sp.AAC.1